jgi:hypothetical protein
MVKPWQSTCPMCGESAFIHLRYPYFLHCETCGAEWTMGELEIYELSHPDKETIMIVNQLMKLAFDMAMEKK